MAEYNRRHWKATVADDWRAIRALPNREPEDVGQRSGTPQPARQHGVSKQRAWRILDQNHGTQRRALHLARISHRAPGSIRVGRARGKVMISVNFPLVCSRRVAVHAEPITALDALKLASLAVTRGTSMYLALRAALQLRKTAVLPFCPSTHSHRYGPSSMDLGSRAARDDLDSAQSLAIPERNAG